MTRILIYSIVLNILTSCGPEEGETIMTSEFSSVIAAHNVQIIGYAGSNTSILYSDSLGSTTLKVGADGLYDTWPSGDTNISVPRDSVLIIFNDTLKLVHLTLQTNAAPDSILIRDNIILFDDPRNIYNINSYATERVTESRWTARYTVVQEDLEYALEVN